MKNCVFWALGAKTTVFHWVFWYFWLSAQSEKAPGPSGQFQIAGKAGLARLAWLGWARQGCPDWAVWTGLAILSEESGSGKCPFQAALGEHLSEGGKCPFQAGLCWPGWVNTDGKCAFQAGLGWPGWVNTCPVMVTSSPYLQHCSMASMKQ